MYEFTQQMKIATENCLQLATGRPKEKLIQMFDELQKELNEQFKEMHDNIAQFMKMHETEKHKANQLQKNIISENNDTRDKIPFLPTTIGSDVSKPYQQDKKLSNDDTKSLSLNEKLDANHSIVSTSSTSDCSQSEEVLAATLSLSSKTDCSQSAEDIVFPHPNPDCIKSDHSLNTDPECLLLSNSCIKLFGPGWALHI